LKPAPLLYLQVSSLNILLILNTTKMKQNSIFLTAAFLLGVAVPGFSQKLQDDGTFVLNNKTTIKVGDDLTIGRPADYDFINITPSKHGFGLGAIANAAGSVGSSVGLLGAESGHLKTAMTGIKVMNTANTVSNIGESADAIAALNVSNKAKEIIGKKFRILRFKDEGNERRGHHVYAFVAGEGKTNYKIELYPAIESQEVIAVNENKLTSNN